MYIVISASIDRLSYALLLISFSLISCTNLNIPDHIARHIVMVEGQGKPVKVAGKHSGLKRAFTDYPTLSDEKYQLHIDKILEGLRDHPKHDTASGKRRKVLFFIHGGLNTQTKTLNRAIDLYQEGALMEAGYYPIFINWQSSLLSSYRDHLLYVRQGRWRDWGFIASPFYLVGDFLRGVIRAPFTWYYMFENAFESSLDLADTRHAEDAFDEAEGRYHKANKGNPDIHPGAIAISQGPKDIQLGEEIISGFQYVITLPTKLISAPIIDAMGTSSWDVMLRRTTTLFHRDGEFDAQADEFDAPESGEGALSVFLQRFSKEVAENRQDWEITVVGHSMGGIVINEILKRFGDLHFDNIVYMGAAGTVRQYEDSLYPYLKNSLHDTTQVYHLVLHEEAEVRERWDEFTIIDFPPRGSLLVWIDNFLSKPVHPLDRTLGRWSNLVPALRNTPKKIRDRIHVKAFGVGSELQEIEPQEHSHFTQRSFWEERFWKPELHK